MCSNHTYIRLSWVTSIYNCPCNVRYGSKVKLHGRNHGDQVKLRPQFCKWRSQKGRQELENYDDKNKNGREPSTSE